MRDLPEHDAGGILFHTLAAELRRVLVQAFGYVAPVAARRTVTDRAVLRIKFDTREQIFVGGGQRICDRGGAAALHARKDVFAAQRSIRGTRWSALAEIAPVFTTMKSAKAASTSVSAIPTKMPLIIVSFCQPRLGLSWERIFRSPRGMVHFMIGALMRSLIAVAFFVLCGAAPALADPTPPPAPAPSPVTFSGVITGFTFHADNPNAAGALDTASGADLATRTQLGNALITVARTTGTFRFSVTAGAYAFPVVGQAINPTFQQFANTNLYGYLPNAYVQYVPNANWTISAGKLPTLLGQENAFTFQNINIQRGLVWNMEPVVSNGIRVAYNGAKFSAALEYNDGFYSGSRRAVEGLLGWNPTVASSLQFIFIIPDANTPSNNTVLIANKREYDLMYTQQIGKLQLLPYALWVQSPASSALGYVRSQSAFGAVLLANYAFNGAFSLGGRFETVGNSSSTGDFSFNSDLIGYGPGSSATTLTLTPTYKSSHLFVRGEWSHAAANNVLPTLGFGPGGTRTNQTRVGLELGAQF